MTILFPAALGGLGLLAAVAALYFLKKRPQPLEVSALFLWPQATSRSRSAWRWYRAPLGLLLLQLLSLALLVGGLAQPAVLSQAQSAGRIALIVDTSASMRTRLAQGTRLDQARQRSEALVRQAGNAEITLIEARRDGGVVVPLVSDAGQVLRALDALAPTYYGDAAGETVLQWVQSQAPLSSFDRIVWFSDRLPDDGPWRDYGVAVDVVDPGQANAAITAFSVRLQPDANLGYEGFVRVENFSGQPLEAALTLSSDGGFSIQAPIAVPAQGSANYTFPLTQTIPKQLRASMDVADGVDFDNERFFAFQTRQRRHVYWLGEPDRFFENALAVVGAVDVSSWSPQVVLGANDILVVNGQPVPVEVTGGNVLLIDAGWAGRLEAFDVRPVRRVRATDLTHPVLAGITPENLIVTTQRLAGLPEGFVTLFEADGTQQDGALPLMGLYQAPGTRLAWWGFALSRSNLRLTVDFPILVSNLLRWLAPLPIEASAVDTGDPLFLPPQTLGLVLPNLRPVSVDGGAYLDTAVPGLYHTLNQAAAWAVNVPAGESQPGLGARRAELSGASAASHPQSVVNPLWAALVLAGMLVLAAEWVSYERGWL